MKLSKLYRALLGAWFSMSITPAEGVIRGEGDRGTSQLPVKSMQLRPYTIAAALTLTEADHAGRTGYFNVAAGVTVTLPRSTGGGAKYRFVVNVTVTSVNDVIKVGNVDDSMVGTVHMAQDAGDTSVTFEIAANDDTITMNGSTKGGLKGDIIEIEDVAEGVFFVRACLQGTGIEATPMSAAV